MNKSIVRDSNFELLRIITMFMIVILHIGSHGIQKQLNVTTEISELSEIVYYFIRSLSIVAVNLYVLISAYFLINNKAVNFKKVSRLFMETSFFCTVVYLTLLALDLATFDLTALKESIIAIIYGEYWFVTVYFVLFIFSPYINKVLDVLGEKEHKKLIVILFFICCVWQFFYNNALLGVSNGYGITYFVFLYVVGNYVRKYHKLFGEIKPKIYLGGYLLLGVINSFLIYRESMIQGDINKWLDYCSPIVFLMSYFLFQYFKSLKIKSIKINTISAAVFGIYLVHEQPFMRHYLWNNSGIISEIIAVDGIYFIVYMLLYCVALFICFWIISFLIGKVFNLLYNVIEKKLVK